MEGVRDKRVLTDGTRTVEIHHIAGNLHADGLLMVYLPKEKLLSEADTYTPPPPNAPPPVPSNPNTVNLADNIARLGLAVDQLLPLHGRIVPLAELHKADRAGATERHTGGRGPRGPRPRSAAPLLASRGLRRRRGRPRGPPPCSASPSSSGADSGVIRAFRDRCAHRGTALSLGRVQGDTIVAPITAGATAPTASAATFRSSPIRNACRRARSSRRTERGTPRPRVGRAGSAAVADPGGPGVRDPVWR